jgi:carboxypeptidase T
VASGEYQLWRKNRRNNGDGSMGVDLNRNYGYGWGGDGASASPDDETYRGAKAFSEPETQNVKAFFDSHSNITIDLTFHTFSELILYPWGHTNEQIADAKAYAVHKTMAETMAKWNHYTPEQASDLYITSGDTTDWAFGTHGIISFTFELDPKMMFDASRGFYPGQDFIMPVFQKNLEPCLYLIEYADNPYRVLDKTGPAYGLAVGTL